MAQIGELLEIMHVTLNEAAHAQRYRPAFMPADIEAVQRHANPPRDCDDVARAVAQVPQPL